MKELAGPIDLAGSPRYARKYIQYQDVAPSMTLYTYATRPQTTAQLFPHQYKMPLFINRLLFENINNNLTKRNHNECVLWNKH